ncbi:hypothetical protein JRO89_XS02G0143900 [Xanthoceras sorbifolium]|uniref:Uncharacterized protein n=1 Tax=Xanthoceras sorbifolium TaxID=99658 RepID=A0ABQ8IFX1_9ROSI|nr:hypothetical protein JRO89_XS02G0143900 [Xanthoceras sorbifolium]
MDKLCKELDEAKAEIKKPKAEYQIKEELSNSLKKAHNEQLLKFQEAEIAQELTAKFEELTEARHLLEGLKSGLHEKELSLSQLDSAKEKLSANCREKLQRETRKLVSTLDEALGEKKEPQCVGLKKHLLVSEKKCVEAEQKAQEPKEVRIRNDVILKLEEENRSIQDQLKWNIEQFKHLEEAHKQLQDQFRLTEAAWEMDKSAMYEENFSLQTRLDSQTSISNSLHTQLEICNRALAHQESRRKLLEVQLSEFKHRCKNEFQEDKMKFESLTAHRDEEIAELRYSQGNKEAFFKELILRVAHLEQENQEHVESLKELEESQRSTGTASLVTKLHNELKCLVQVRCSCSKNLKARESEGRSQLEEIKSNITRYKSELKSKEKEIQESHMDLENFHSTVDVLNEEISILLMVLKLEFSEAYSKLLNELRDCSKEKDDNIAFLAEQWEMKNGARNKAQAQLHLEQEHEKLAALLKRIESLEFMDQRQILLMKELEKLKRMLRESSESQLQLKQQVLQMENALKYDRREIFDTLEKAELELAEKIRDGNELKFELQNLKFTAKSLKNCLGESEYTCREMETSLIVEAENEKTLEQEKECILGIVKEQDNPKPSMVAQQATTSEREALEALIEEERDNLLQISEEKNSYIDTVHNDASWLMEDSFRRELEVEYCTELETKKAFKMEEERLLKILNEKEQKFRDLQVLVTSMEEDLISTVTSYFSEITEIQIETSVISETLNNVEHQRKLEIEEKNKVISELEEELKAQKLETEKLTNQFGNEKNSMMVLIKELELENGVLLQDIKKLSEEKENTLMHIEEFCDQLSEISCEDSKLIKTLQELQSCEKETEPVVDAKVSVELHSSAKKNANSSFFPTTTKNEVEADERSPLKELNN